MPASKTATKKKAPAKKANLAATKKPVAASKAKPAARISPAAKPKAVAKQPAPARGKAPAKATVRSASRKSSPVGPATITVGDVQYVLGEYGQLMSMEEYERMMAKK